MELPAATVCDPMGVQPCDDAGITSRCPAAPAAFSLTITMATTF